jgi:4-amino-4-deoxy-L-arabinose transferase-like glycosyltransferase
MNTKKRFLVALLLVFCLLRVLSFAGSALPEWDESVYLATGKYIFSGGSAGLFEPIRPLVLPAVTGLFWQFGLDYILASRIFVLLCSLGVLYLVYLLGRDIFSENVGILAATLLALTPIFFSQSTLIYTSMPATLLSLLATYFFIRKRYVWAGLFVALATMTRYTQVLVFLVFVLFLIFDYISEIDLNYLRHAGVIAAVFGAVLLPYLLLHQFLSGDALGSLFSALSHSGYAVYAVDNSLQNILYYFLEIFLINGALIFALYFFYYYLTRGKNLVRNQFLIATLFLSHIIFFTAIVNKQMRFALVFLPFYALLAAQGILFVWKRYDSRQMRIAFAMIVAVFLLVQTGMLNVQSYVSVVDADAREFDTYFESYPTGTVLTTHPRPAAYTDHAYVPLYGSVTDALIQVSSQPEAIGVMIIPASYACEELGDVGCAKVRDELVSLLHEQREMVYNKTHYGQAHYIFI